MHLASSSPHCLVFVNTDQEFHGFHTKICFNWSLPKYSKLKVDSWVYMKYGHKQRIPKMKLIHSNSVHTVSLGKLCCLWIPVLSLELLNIGCYMGTWKANTEQLNVSSCSLNELKVTWFLVQFILKVDNFTTGVKCQVNCKKQLRKKATIHQQNHHASHF